jgi:hypothetical protein
MSYPPVRYQGGGERAAATFRPAAARANWST